MRATVLRNKALVIDDVPTPEPGNGKVLIKTHACGVCGSDLHAASHADQLADALRRSDALTAEEYAATLRKIADGRIAVDPLITGRISPDGLSEAFSALASPEMHAKIVVAFGR